MLDYLLVLKNNCILSILEILQSSRAAVGKVLLSKIESDPRGDIDY